MRLASQNTALVLDSSVDLPRAVAEARGWRIVSHHVVFGDESFRDHMDLSPAEFLQRLARSDEPPQTAYPSPGDFAVVLESLEGVERIFAVILSRKLSGAFESALLAADSRTVVIDAGTISGGIRLLAEAIERRLARGTTDEEIDALAARYRERGRFVLALATDTYLARGGRAGRRAGGSGPTRPIVHLAGGEAVVVGVVRTAAAGRAQLERALVDETTDGAQLHVGVAHAGAPADAQRLTERVRELRPRSSVAAPVELGPALTSHAGPGAVGLYWFEDSV